VNDASQTHWVWFEGMGAGLGGERTGGPHGSRRGVPRWRPPEGIFPGTCPPATIGWVVKHYNYDGVGRIYRTTSKIDAASLPSSYVFNSGATSFTRSERFFYDGTRRIQEVVTDPIIVHEEGDVPSINGQLLTPPPEGVGEFTRLKTQYVWGPGDSPTSGVMELLRVTEITKNASGTTVEYPRLVLYDAQGDVAALVQPPGVGGTAAAAVTAQWTWRPYGKVLTYEEFYPHQPLKVGHKGLFVDRLDTGPLVFDMYTWTAAEPARLIPGAKLIGHTPNRTYSPGLGRWLQQDPHRSGILQVENLTHRAPSASITAVDLRERLVDGHSLYGYVRGEPISRRDELGLYSWKKLGEDVMDSNFSVPGPSDFISGALNELMSQYAARQMFDVEWASDWSLGDDEHSRTENLWVDIALLKGIYDTFEFGVGDYKFNPFDHVGGSSSSGKTSKSRIDTRRGVAHMSGRISVDGYHANVYARPGGGRDYVLFDDNAVQRTVRVNVTNRAQERADANRLAGFADKAPDGWVWHHHSTRRGIMQLVPKGLHQRVGHIGRADW
jgi:hypothetical protein